MLQLRLADEVPSIRARRLRLHGEIQDAVADAFEAELGPDSHLAAWLAAASLIAALGIVEETAAARMIEGGQALAAEVDALLEDAAAFAEAGIAAVGEALSSSAIRAAARAAPPGGDRRGSRPAARARPRSPRRHALRRRVLDLERARVAVAGEPVGDVDALLEVALERERDERPAGRDQLHAGGEPALDERDVAAASTRSRSGT